MKNYREILQVGLFWDYKIRSIYVLISVLKRRQSWNIVLMFSETKIKEIMAVLISNKNLINGTVNQTIYLAVAQRHYVFFPQTNILLWLILVY